jgi:hypothetical protein
MMSRLSPGVLSELFLTGVITAFEADGDKEVGNWTTTDRMGKNVTVYTMSTRNPHLRPLGGTYGIASWSLDSSTYAILVSMLDRNNTTLIIRTLAIA